jgi:hypothetical protein
MVMVVGPPEPLALLCPLPPAKTEKGRIKAKRTTNVTIIFRILSS